MNDEPTKPEQLNKADLPKGATIKSSETYNITNLNFQPITEVRYIEVPISCCPRCGWRGRV